MTVAESVSPIRSYQRIFRPDRRIYRVDGRRLPVPGGVRIEWVGWAFAALVGVLVLGERSLAVAVILATVGGLLGASWRGLKGATVGVLGGFAGAFVVGVLLGWLAWPLRLLVLPGMVATLAGQSTPDGRAAHRYLVSWVALHLRAESRRPVDDGAEAGRRVWAPLVWFAADEHSPVLQHGRVCGPARLVCAQPVVVIPRRGRLLVRPAEGHRVREGERLAQVIVLAAGQMVEVRG